MSGGHYDYAYSKVLVMVGRLEAESSSKNVWDSSSSDGNKEELRPEEERIARLKMAEFLTQVSEAMRALEWCDSGDSSWDEAVKEFEKVGCVLKKDSPEEFMAEMKPMTVEEVRELFSMTLHGSLPRKTMNRIFATLADWASVIEEVRKNQ